MPAQKREARRNYIELVSNEAELYTAVGSEPAPILSLKAYLLKLAAVILRIRGVAR